MKKQLFSHICADLDKRDSERFLTQICSEKNSKNCKDDLCEVHCVNVN